MPTQSSELTVYKDAASQLRSLNREFIELGQKSLALALVMGELLTKERSKIPPRGGWLKYLEGVEIHHASAANYMRLWKRRSILLRVSNITLTEAYRLTRPPKKRGVTQRLKDQSTRNVSKKSSFEEFVLGLLEGLILTAEAEYPDKTRGDVIDVICNQFRQNIRIVEGRSS